MPAPGQFSDIALDVLEKTGARAVVLVVYDGQAGSGFCVETDHSTGMPDVVEVLRHILNQLELDRLGS